MDHSAKRYFESLSPRPRKAFNRLLFLLIYTCCVGIVLTLPYLLLVDVFDPMEGFTSLALLMGLPYISFIYVAPSNVVICLIVWACKKDNIVFKNKIGFFVEPIVYFLLVSTYLIFGIIGRSLTFWDGVIPPLFMICVILLYNLIKPNKGFDLSSEDSKSSPINTSISPDLPRQSKKLEPGFSIVVGKSLKLWALTIAYPTIFSFVLLLVSSSDKSTIDEPFGFSVLITCLIILYAMFCWGPINILLCAILWATKLCNIQFQKKKYFWLEPALFTTIFFLYDGFFGEDVSNSLCKFYPTIFNQDSFALMVIGWMIPTVFLAFILCILQYLNDRKSKPLQRTS